jgi:hypothetical protein
MIHNPGPLHRTAGNAVIRVLSQYFAPRPFQYTQTGVHAAIREAKKAIQAGHVHIARLDIKDFYLNFSVEALINELPLPKEVVEHVVSGRHLAVVMDKGNGHGETMSLSPIHMMDCFTRPAWELPKVSFALQ